MASQARTVKGERQMGERNVLVTTQHRGVFFGTVAEERDDGRTIVLTGARCAIHWATTGGFLELAAVGPNSKSRIGDRAKRIVLYDVTSVADCSDEAVKRWNEHRNS